MLMFMLYLCSVMLIFVIVSGNLGLSLYHMTRIQAQHVCHSCVFRRDTKWKSYIPLLLTAFLLIKVIWWN